MIISIYNSKGGTGKTITAVNLAAALATPRRRVLLVDLDNQYSATSLFLNEDPAYSVYNVLFDGVQVNQATAEVAPNLHLLASTPLMENAARRLPDEVAAEQRLARALRHAEFDICILDCPGNWDYVTRNALMAATHVLIPINSERMAFDCAVDTSVRAEELSTAYDRPQEIGVLLTAYRETNASRDVAQAAGEEWPGQLLKTRIRFTEQAKTLTADRKTIADRAAATLREDYQKLSKEVLKRWPNK